MDNFKPKRHIVNVKLSGLGNLDLDQDKPFEEDYEEAFRRHQEAEEMKRALQHKHLDPFYMESDLPEAPDTGSISLNPDDMTFNF